MDVYVRRYLYMLIANTIFAAIVARMERRNLSRSPTLFYRQFCCSFSCCCEPFSPQQVWLVARSFFVWVSVFNLFNTAIFWAFMTDLFTVEQGKRLFGFIAVGGSLGAIAGACITKHLMSHYFRPADLLAMSATMFAIVCFLGEIFSRRISRARANRYPRGETNRWKYLVQLLPTYRSPYLFGLVVSIFIIPSRTPGPIFSRPISPNIKVPDKASADSVLR